MPSHLPPLTYPGHYKQACVNPNGTIWLNGVNVYIGYLLKGETIGLEQIDHDLWEVSYGNIRICRINKNKKAPLAMTGKR